MQFKALLPLLALSAGLVLSTGCEQADDEGTPGGGGIVLLPPATPDAFPSGAGGQGGGAGGQGGQGGAAGQGGQGGGAGGQGGEGQGGQGGGAGGQGGDGGQGGGAGGQGGQGGGAGGQGGQGGGAGGQGGQGGGAGGSPVQAGALGAPCEDPGDCDGGLCLGLPNGYCSQACDDQDCPEGGSCWNFGDAGQACLLNCEDSAQCRRNEGYICDADNTCYPGEAPAPPGDGDVGSPCMGNGDCGNGGQCVGADQGFPGGYCVVFGCSDESPCPGGAECFQLQGGDTVCLDLCRNADDCRDGYVCRPDVGACMPGCQGADDCPDGTICTDEGLCEEPPCTPNSCDEGLICADSGRCVIDIGVAPEGPVPNCNVPSWRCEGGEAECGQIELFLPARGEGYWDYPANGETVNNPYRSWARRDGIMLSKYAGALTECLSQNWDFGNGGPVCIGDCSEEDGGIPGASIGRPGHPEGTHTNGYDLDMGYYQVNTENNWMRPVCEHYINGQDQYHCVGEPFALDPWRSALYLGLLHHSPQLRVIGVDGRIGPLIDSAADQLCEAGFLDGPACVRRTRAITYEEQDAGRGWFRFHHHHWHISLSSRREAGLDISYGPSRGPDACLRADCLDAEWPAAAALKRLPNMAERRFRLSTPARDPITTTWTPDQTAIFHEIERVDAEDARDDD